MSRPEDNSLNHERVQNWIKKLLEHGCTVSIEFVESDSMQGGFNIDDKSIRISRIPNVNIMSNTIIHELIHAYDDCRQMLVKTDCQSILCSEIRAAAMSGDCTFGMELLRGNISIFDGFVKCVQRRALLATRMQPNCKNIELSQDLLNKCIKDKSPFDI
jgi:inner membrane protease ATP23